MTLPKKTISDNLNERNRKTQEREMYEKTPIKFHVNKITQRISLSLPDEKSSPVIFIADGVIMSGAGRHFPKLPYDIVRIHTLMIYRLVEYNIVGDTYAAFSQLVPFKSSVKSGDIVSTRQYVKYQNF